MNKTPCRLKKIGVEVIDKSTNKNLGYESLHLRFVDQRAITKDAFEFTLSPGGRSEIFRVTDKNVKIIDTLIKGKAWLIRYIPDTGSEGKIEIIKLEKPGTSVEHPHNSIFCWISKDTNKTVLFGTNSPPYEDSQETEYKLDNKNVPDKLRRMIIALLT